MDRYDWQQLCQIAIKSQRNSARTYMEPLPQLIRTSYTLL
ncbi:hypothetical protein EVA_19877 [gut metagenome]|uniref:Uncharacterized protein n=1 Tax=gut metagenome TaxID=749906 RepID=J9FR18_9ZZZZ